MNLECRDLVCLSRRFRVCFVTLLYYLIFSFRTDPFV